MDTAGGTRAAAPAWDFFVSYTAADQGWAEWVAWQLEEAGYRVLFQAWDFVPGSHWTTRMEEGIRGAERTLAILSHAYLNSVYGRAEWQAAYRADPQGLRRKLIPARVEDCNRPGLLGEVVSFDLFDCPADTARRRLHDKISEALAGRAKPPTAPAFPSPAATRPSALLPPQQAPPSTAPHFPGRPTTSRRGSHRRPGPPGSPTPRARHRRTLAWIFTSLLIAAVIAAINLVDFNSSPPASPNAIQPTAGTGTGSGISPALQPTAPAPGPTTASSPLPEGVLAQGTLRMKSPDVANLEQGLVGPGVTPFDLYLHCSAGRCELGAASGETTTEGLGSKDACTTALSSRNDSPLDLPRLSTAMRLGETLCVQTNESHVAALQIFGIPGAGTSELVFSYTLWR